MHYLSKGVVFPHSVGLLPMMSTHSLGLVIVLLMWFKFQYYLYTCQELIIIMKTGQEVWGNGLSWHC